MDPPKHTPRQTSYKEIPIEDWDENHLIGWIQEKKPRLLHDGDIEKLRNERVTGLVFLRRGCDKFFRECGLALGMAAQLTLLLEELAEEDGDGKRVEGAEMLDIPLWMRRKERARSAENSYLSSKNLSPTDYTLPLVEVERREGAGLKRNTEQAGFEMPKPASKMPRLNDAVIALQELAATARQRRDCILQVLEKFAPSTVPSSKDVPPSKPSNVPDIVSQFSDPAFEHKLPFPFVGFQTPERFDIKAGEETWFYTGREKFAGMMGTFKEIRQNRGIGALYVYGTRGYGKSHLLAAAVCALTAKKLKVVYIPDCLQLLRDPIDYMISAMLFAWADDEKIQRDIIELTTMDAISAFVRRRNGVVFVIDQLNALQVKKDDEFETTKIQLKKWLSKLTATHASILSSSANNSTALNDEQRQTGQRLERVYGGLTKAEMKCWWKRNHNIDRGDYTQDEVEDFTGRIPLFLTKCIVKDEKGKEKINLASEFFADVYDEALMFESVFQERNKDDHHALSVHYRYLNAALFNRPVPISSKNVSGYIDYRYFYDRYDDRKQKRLGYATCGVARNAITPTLLANKVRYINGDFLRSLPEYIKNKCVVGYTVEQAVLAAIATHGLDVADVGGPMEVRVLDEQTPIQNPKEGLPQLLIPRNFNHRAIDGIIVRVEKRNKEQPMLFMYPLQITVAKKHKDSHKEFFNDWKRWATTFPGFRLFPTFIWITKEGGKKKSHSGNLQWPDHDELNIPVRQVSEEIERKYKTRKESGLLQDGLESFPSSSQSGEGRISQPGMPEEPGEPGEPEKQGELEELQEQTGLYGPTTAGKRPGKQPRAKKGGTNFSAQVKAIVQPRSLRSSGKKMDMAILPQDNKSRNKKG